MGDWLARGIALLAMIMISIQFFIIFDKEKAPTTAPVAQSLMSIDTKPFSSQPDYKSIIREVAQDIIKTTKELNPPVVVPQKRETQVECPEATTVESTSICPSDMNLEECEGNQFCEFFKIHKEGPICSKHQQYLGPYLLHFSKFKKQKKIRLVEVGVQSGGSIDMWRYFFGASKLEYYGVDINPATLKFQKEGVKVVLGDQSNATFWKEFFDAIPGPVDIFIDDGGYKPEQQIATFESVFPRLRNGGIYLCEDLQTNYVETFYGGGYKKPTTFIERIGKPLVDDVNAWVSKDSNDKNFKPTEYTKSITGLHFYQAMLFIDKANKETEYLKQINAGTDFIPYLPNTRL